MTAPAHPYRSVIIIACTGLLIGIIAHGIRNRWIIIRPPQTHSGQKRRVQENITTAQGTSQQRQIVLHYNDGTEKRDIVWDDLHQGNNLATVATTYFTMLTEEDLLHTQIKVQTAALNTTGNHATISCSHTFFEPAMSTRTKWKVVDGLLQSIRTTFKDVTEVTLLVNHQPLNDPHLELSQPIPTVRAQPMPQVSRNTPQEALYTRRILMIDPFGDARTPGRTIGQAFERTITGQYAEALKRSIEATDPYTQVIITRTPGEVVAPLQRAAFANRLHVGCFIRLQAYQHAAQLPEISVSYMDYPSTIDQSADGAGNRHLTLIPYQYAHRGLKGQNYRIAQTLTTELRNRRPRANTIAPVQGLPLTPLSGINVPACVIELGLKNAELDPQLVEALTAGIITAITSS